MFPGIDGFHWTFGHILFLSLFFAVVVRFWQRSLRRWCERCAICDSIEQSTFAGNLISRNCRCPIGDAVMSWQDRVTSRICDNAFRLPALRELFQVRVAAGRRESIGPRDSKIRQIVTITEDTHG